MSQSEQDELLTLLEQERVEVETADERWAEIEATRPQLDIFMPAGVSEYTAARPVSWLPGERPPIAEFVASFAPVMPPKPVERKSRATELPPPDVPLRVPPQRRGKLLDDVLTRTQEEMAAGRQSDDVDKLQPYRGVGQRHLDGSEFPDE